MIADAEMRTAHRILRDGAQMLREHCAPVQVWRELDEKADALEQGINPFARVQKTAPVREVVEEDEGE